MRAIVVLLVLNPLGLSLVGCSQSQPSSATPSETPDAGNTGKCTVQLSGNTSHALSFPSCGALSFSANGSDGGARDVVLNFHWSTAGLRALDVAIALGASPTVGDYSSETVHEWSAFGVARPGCEYVAGSQSVPRGRFKLTLSALEIVDAGAQAGVDSGADAAVATQADSGAAADADLDADSARDADSGADGGTGRPAGVAQGRLELTLAVHAAPATDCGAGEVEDLVVEF
jgi:hypothetical protein